MSAIAIVPVKEPIRGSVRPPGSKSITNRALVLAALAEGPSHLRGLLDSQDTRVMIESLRRLGLSITHDPAEGTAQLAGCAGSPPATSAELWLENSGTSIRFLTAVACLGTGTYRLDGNSRMRQHPIGELCEALGSLAQRRPASSQTDVPRSSSQPTACRGERRRSRRKNRASFSVPC